METFGSWILNLREKQRIDLRSLSLKSNIHFTTINRVEKDHNEPTLFTAIKIAESLNGHPEDLYQRVMGERTILPFGAGDYHPFFPTNADVRLFDRLIVQKPRTVGGFIADILNALAVASNFDNREIFQRLKNGNEEQTWLWETFNRPNFSAEDVIKFLLNIPKQLFGLSVFSQCLHYPGNFPADLVKQVYFQNGVLIHQDLSLYLSSLYNQIASVKENTDYKSAKEFADITTTKERFCNQDKVSGIKLADIFALDRAFSDDHTFFMMAWFAAQEEILAETENAGFVVRDILVILSRFLASNISADKDWLLYFRDL